MAMTAAEDQAFTEFLMTKAAEAEWALKYRPTQFLQMLASSGGYATAVQLLSSRRISEGFETLWSKKRLDLAVEALVLEGHWAKALRSSASGDRGQTVTGCKVRAQGFQ